MFLSETAAVVSLLIRGSDLRKMSAYLSARLRANKKVRIRYRTEVVGVEGVEHICTVRIREPDGKVNDEPSSGLFVFIGARPRTDFLPASMAKDDKGFLVTGPEVAFQPAWTEARPPYPLETSLPGVFAAGDCRRDTAKRISVAIGEGALAITSVHNFNAWQLLDHGGAAWKA
jgi:thioredoxin reductase (NADPH)